MRRGIYYCRFSPCDYLRKSKATFISKWVGVIILGWLKQRESQNLKSEICASVFISIFPTLLQATTTILRYCPWTWNFNFFSPTPSTTNNFFISQHLASWQFDIHREHVPPLGTATFLSRHVELSSLVRGRLWVRR